MIRSITHIAQRDLNWQFLCKASIRHHFFIDCDHADYIEIKRWCAENISDGYQVYPEMITENLTSSVERIHVTFDSDRDASIFKLSW